MNLTKLSAAAPLLIGAFLMTIAPPAKAQIPALKGASPLPVGATAPNIALPDQNGKMRKLTADRGRVVLLAFYPADFTTGCTLEAHALTGAYRDLKALGVKVYGVSAQDPKSHAAFCTKEGIPYTLLADTKKVAAKDYGVLNSAHGVANRVTFIIDPSRKIAYVDPNVNSHLATCGEDWVAWIKAHPQSSKTTASVKPANFTQALGAPIHKLGLTAALASTGTPQALGKPAPNFTLPNAVTGTRTSLNAAMAGKKMAVVMFISTRCPISAAYNQRMISLANEYTPKGVAFIAINANHNEPLSEVKAQALEDKYPFPVLKDATDKVANSYDAHVTPETYVINSDGTLVYHGRIDNSDDPSQVTTRDLAAALNNVLSGQSVAKARTKAFGCSISRPM